MRRRGHTLVEIAAVLCIMAICLGLFITCIPGLIRWANNAFKIPEVKQPYRPLPVIYKK